ncbi:MAG: hypothetical protein NVSMB9_22070 [Isosphaeraceae bacterium]
MERTFPGLVIDARPAGPRGPLAVERIQGRSVLEHLLDLAQAISPSLRPISVHALPKDQPAFAETLALRPPGSFLLTSEIPPERTSILRSDRLYDLARLRKVLRKGSDLESAVIWRLDGPHALAGAGEELIRRQTYQPIGRYWALAPARSLARWLAPTRVRPNAVTLTASAFMIGASAVMAGTASGWFANFVVALALAAALVLDTADGHLARLQGTASPFGRWLDAWLDEVGDMALHASIAWSMFQRTGSTGWLLLGMFYAMGKYVFLAGATVGDVESTMRKESVFPVSQPSFPTKAIHIAGHADVRLHVWILLAAVGRLDVALAAYAVYYPLRAILGALRKGVRLV